MPITAEEASRELDEIKRNDPNYHLRFARELLRDEPHVLDDAYYNLIGDHIDKHLIYTPRTRVH